MQPFFAFMRLIERAAALAQGKGYGTATVRQEIRLLGRLTAASPSLIIDVGANKGVYTAELRRRYPLAEIHAFEPSATNVAHLRSRFDGDARVTIVPAALSDGTGQLTLYSNSAGSGLASLTRRRLDHFGKKFDLEEKVDAMRFEDYWTSSLAKRELDFVKVDVEGHELGALKGFGAALDTVKVLQFEFGGCNIDTRTYFQDFWYFLKERGFALFRISPFGLERIAEYSEQDEFFSTSNYFAARIQSQ